MKFELTIDASYLDNGRWDAAAGIREFMQNGRDAAIEQKAALEVSHYINADGKGVLVIENEGAVLTKDTLLLGRTTKADRQDELAGKYGEGYKLGSLALLRAGYEVKIRNGSEVWTPTIEPSDKFEGRSVLVFTVATGRAERNRVRVDIIGVSAEDWKALRENYLFLYRRELKQVETPYGAILTGPKFKGKVFVKEILVMYDDKLQYGYNLKDAELDRDRRIIENYDRQARLNKIWGWAVSNSPVDLFDEFYGMLRDNSLDVQGLSKWNTERLSAEVAKLVAERFQKDHGADAIPVATLADSKDVEHLGARGIVAPSPLAAALAKTLGDMDTVKNKLKEEVREHLSWPDLKTKERANLERALALVAPSAAVSLEEVDIVSFRSPTLEGQFKDGRILIARRILASRQETLAVVVHEVAHRNGIDGDKGHVAEIERIWAEIVERLT